MNLLFLRIGIISLFLWVIFSLILALVGKYKAMATLIIVFCFIVIGAAMALVVIQAW